ncbi:MAG: sensor of ECF-type sigma factor [Algicola sp.]|nr:sensor of ECF-type sigma factor [Algicola sp.]
MKKITLYLFILGLSFSSLAQEKSKKEKIEALKIAFITEHVNLTKQEAQNFWPIYNAYENNTDALRKTSSEKRKSKSPETLTETEAKELLLNMIKVDEQKKALKSQYINDLLTIMPATKVIGLFRAEHAFKRKMFEEFKKRRGACD